MTVGTNIVIYHGDYFLKRLINNSLLSWRFARCKVYIQSHNLGVTGIKTSNKEWTSYVDRVGYCGENKWLLAETLFGSLKVAINRNIGDSLNLLDKWKDIGMRSIRVIIFVNKNVALHRNKISID